MPIVRRTGVPSVQAPSQKGVRQGFLAVSTSSVATCDGPAAAYGLKVFTSVVAFGAAFTAAMLALLGVFTTFASCCQGAQLLRLGTPVLCGSSLRKRVCHSVVL